MEESLGKKYYELSVNINAKDYLATFHSDIRTDSPPLKWQEFEDSLQRMVSILNVRADLNEMINIEFCLETAKATFKNLKNDEILVEEIDKLFEILFPVQFKLCIYTYMYIVKLQIIQFTSEKAGTRTIPWLMRISEEKEETIKRMKLGKANSN